MAHTAPKSNGPAPAAPLIYGAVALVFALLATLVALYALAPVPKPDLGPLWTALGTALPTLAAAAAGWLLRRTAQANQAETNGRLDQVPNDVHAAVGAALDAAVPSLLDQLEQRILARLIPHQLTAGVPVVAGTSSPAVPSVPAPATAVPPLPVPASHPIETPAELTRLETPAVAGAA